MSALAGRTILVTREAGQAAELSGELRARGARVIEAPVIGFADPADWSPADAAIAALPGYHLILLTSANAVERFAARMAARGASAAQLRDTRVTAIGPATAAAARRAFGVEVDEVAADHHAEGLVAHLLAGGAQPAGWRVLLPRAEAAREVLPEALRARGARVDVVPVYRTVTRPVSDEVITMLKQGEIDAITFTSASTVDGFLEGVGSPLPPDVVIAVIGPVTAEAARARGMAAGVVAPRATMASLAGAIAAHYEADHPTR